MRIIYRVSAGLGESEMEASGIRDDRRAMRCPHIIH
jgi:hypothetical protein